MVLFDSVKVEIDRGCDGREYLLTKKIQDFFNALKASIQSRGRLYAIEPIEEPRIEHCCELLKRALYQSLEEVVQTTVKAYLKTKKPEEWDSIDCIDTAFKQAFIALTQQYRKIFSTHRDDNQIKAMFSQYDQLQVFFEQNMQVVLKQLSFVALSDMVRQTITSLIKEKVVFHQGDQNQQTILHLVCRHNALRSFKAIIEHGFDFSVPRNHLIALQGIIHGLGYDDLEDYLEGLLSSPVQKTGLNSLLARMGALGSPSSRMGIQNSQSPTFHEHFSSSVGVLRPVLGSARKNFGMTPGQTRLHVAWKIEVDRDSDSPAMVSLYLDEKKVIDLSAVIRCQPKSPPVELPHNSKVGKTIVTRITPEVLQTWVPKYSRYRNQVQTMQGCHSNTVAYAAGFNRSGFHWCHLVAYTMGGPDGLRPLKGEEDYKGPQREMNLVLGTKEANAQMLIVENTVKSLIDDDGFEEIFLTVIPTFSEKYKDFHIAESVEYTIQDKAVNPTRQATFNFNMLTRRRVSEAEVAAVVEVLKLIFLDRRRVQKEIILSPVVFYRRFGSQVEPNSPYIPRKMGFSFDGKENFRALSFEDTESSDDDLSVGTTSLGKRSSSSDDHTKNYGVSSFSSIETDELIDRLPNLEDSLSTSASVSPSASDNDEFEQEAKRHCAVIPKSIRI